MSAAPAGTRFWGSPEQSQAWTPSLWVPPAQDRLSPHPWRALKALWHLGTGAAVALAGLVGLDVSEGFSSLQLLLSHPCAVPSCPSPAVPSLSSSCPAVPSLPIPCCPLPALQSPIPRENSPSIQARAVWTAGKEELVIKVTFLAAAPSRNAPCQLCTAPATCGFLLPWLFVPAW